MVSTDTPLKQPNATAVIEGNNKNSSNWKLAVFLPISFIGGLLVPVLAIVLYLKRFRFMPSFQKKRAKYSPPKKEPEAQKIHETSFKETVKIEINEEETPKRVNNRSPIDILNIFRRRGTPPTLPTKQTDEQGFQNYPMFDEFKEEQESPNFEADKPPSLEGSFLSNILII